MNQIDIAIVGMGCAFPRAANVQQFWRNNVDAVDCIEAVPDHRLQFARNWFLPKDHEAYLNPHKGGFLPQGLGIDPVKFGVLPNIIRNGDADQFLMLYVIEQALADAKLSKDDPRRMRTDCLVGRGNYPTLKSIQLCLRSEYFDTVLQLMERKFPSEFKHRRQEYEQYLSSVLPPSEADSVSTAISNITSSRAANRLNLGGTAHCVDAACASGLVAVEQGLDRLRLGKADYVVAAGFFLTQTVPFLHVFTKLGAVSQQGVIRPMDRRADGLLVGEGAGAVVLKRLEDAVADGDEIYAIIKGAGSSSDGREVDVLAPAAKGQLRALERAYADANVDPDTIGYLELHGTGTVVGDLTELYTVRTFFGTGKHPPTSRAMGSVKSLIGHCMPASGLAALIRTTLAVSNKVLPPSIHCEEPRPELADAPFYVNTTTRPWVQNDIRGPRRAAVNSFGFGGINGHVILEEVVPVKAKKKTKVAVPRPLEPGVTRPSELAVFSGTDLTGLLHEVQLVERFLQEDQQEPTAAELSRSLASRVQFDRPCKLALVYTSIENLKDKLATVRDALQKKLRGEATVTQQNVPLLGNSSLSGITSAMLVNDEDVYFSDTAAKHEGRIAFIFPGMGFPGLIGNYPDHLLELCLHYPALRSEFDFFEERDRHPEDDIPTSAVFVPPPSLPEEFRVKLKNRLAPPKSDADYMKEESPTERYLAAMGVTLANWISWTLLEPFQIPVSMAAGQSQGEMAALCAVGMGDFHATAPAYWKVLNVNPRYTAGGRLAFVWATEEQVTPLVAQNPGTHIAIYMAPMAMILGGDKDGLQRIIDELKKQQCLTQMLPYPPIHTPCLSYLHDDLQEALSGEDFELKPAKITLYSSITTEPYPHDEAGVRKTLMLNLDHPLRVWQTIRRLYDDGARIFVQVGGGHMAAHMKELLPEDARVVTVALDVDTRNPITQLNHLVATLFSSGVPMKLDNLFANRTAATLDLTAPRPAIKPPGMFIPFLIEWTPLTHPNVPVKDDTPVASAPSADARQLGAETRFPDAQSSPIAHDVFEPAGSNGAVSADQNGTASAEQNGSVAAERNGSSIYTASPDAKPTRWAPTWDDDHLPPSSTPNWVDDFTLNPPVVEFDSKMPVLGNVIHYVPDQEIVIERVLDIDQDLFVRDHLFVYAPFRHPQDCLPIVPLTMSLEWTAEVAALLSPGLGLVGYEDVRAKRWIGLEDKPRSLIIFRASVVDTGAEDGIRKIDVTAEQEGKQALAARLLFSSTYQQAIQLDWPDLSQNPAWPCEYWEVYGNRRMFHGPAFQVVTELGTFSNPICTGKLQVLPKDRMFRGNPQVEMLVDPCLLDGIGQFLGLWCQMFDWFVLPTGVERIEVYCPTPPVGTELEIKLHVTNFDLDKKQLWCNVELSDGQGGVWMRFLNWSDWIFRWPLRFQEFQRFPTIATLSQPMELPGLAIDTAFTLAEEADLTGVDLTWAARTMLDPVEMAEFRGMSGNKVQRRFLTSKVAAKDAVRLWRQKVSGESLIHPATYVIDHDALGKPFVRQLPDELVPALSVAHKEGIAVAVAAVCPVGVDLEFAGRDTRSLLETFATPSEIAMIDQLCEQLPEGEWETRLWCAKEAASKVKGTGLQGLPKRLQLTEADDQGRMVIHDVDEGVNYGVQTWALATYLVAVAVPAAVTAVVAERPAPVG
jgi:acyl transferase domain-containing protein/phosphopantetheinyl transferase